MTLPTVTAERRPTPALIRDAREVGHPVAERNIALAQALALVAAELNSKETKNVARG